MNFAKTINFMNRKDNRPPPGVKPMTVRRSATKVLFGKHTITMETSCGSSRPHISGSVKLTLDSPLAPKPLIKRFQVDNHREAMDEFMKLVDMVRAGA